MKNYALFYVLNILFISITLTSQAQNINIPNTNFKTALLNHDPAIDTNNDDEISQTEALAFTGTLDVSDKDITDLTGIEYFTNITILKCYTNPLSSLDVSNNTKLTELYCGSNQLSNLDVSNNTDLTGLFCGNNQLSILDVSKNTKLKELKCSENQLSSLDVSQNTDLENLSCFDNLLSSLDLGQNTGLTILLCKNNKFPFSVLQQIKEDYGKDLGYTRSKNIFSEREGIYGFEVDYSAEVSINGNTTEFTWYNNSNIEVDASFVQEQSTPGIFRFLQVGTYYCKMTNAAFSELELETETITISEILNIPNANFKAALVENTAINTDGDTEISQNEAAAFTGTLDVSEKDIEDLSGIEYFTNITKLYCYNNQLSSLNISQNTALTELYCQDNQLSSLDASQNTSLKILICNNNQLNSLVLGQNTVLWSLSCYNNQLSSLDVSKNTALQYLMCYSNQLNSLVLGQNTSLVNLHCYNNQLSSLDVSQNTNLASLYCNNNLLSNLDVSNNTVLQALHCYDNKLSSLDLSQNNVLQTLSCNNNEFPFSALKSIKNEFTSLIYYTSNSTIFSVQEGVPGHETDYSAEVSINGNTTKFTWYDNNNNEVDASFVQKQSDGVFKFLQTGAYYCIMSNAAFFTDENSVPTSLQTETITIYEDEIIDFTNNGNFKQALLDHDPAIDTNNDDEISLSEAFAFTGELDVAGKSITNLSGIEYFTNITKLYCSHNQLSNLDVSQNTDLTELYCQNNQLSSLDLSKNTALEQLQCNINQLNSLVLGQNTVLWNLSCYGNQLSSLDVSKNTGLQSLMCYNNQLNSLILGQNTSLEHLRCYNNQLGSLDVSKNTNLTTLYCYNNLLSNLDVSNHTTLRGVYCYNNKLSSLVVSQNNILQTLSCNNNKFPFSALKSIKNEFSNLTFYTSDSTIFSVQEGVPGHEIDYSAEVSINGNTTTFTWYDNNNNEVDASFVQKQSDGVFKFLQAGTYYCIMSNAAFFTDQNSVPTSLQTETITIADKTIEFLDENFKQALLDHDPAIDTNNDDEISQSEALAFTNYLKVPSKSISDLSGIEYFTNITGLDCYNNQLSNLDVSRNTALTSLICSNNQLINLDVSHNTNLTELSCQNNQLSSLDLSKNTALKQLKCYNNQLNSLVLGQNTVLWDLLCHNNNLSSLDVSKNTNLQYLTCNHNQLNELILDQNTELVYLECNNNFLSSLNLSQNTKLTKLLCTNNLLSSLNLSQTNLTLLSCNNNKFLFSELKSIKTKHYNVVNYTSVLTILSPQEELTGYEADYSTEVFTNGNTTEFTWYDNNDNEVDASFVQEQSDGIFKFLQAGTYYCIMTNATFPGAELKTETITIGNTIYFPDEKFKTALINAYVDTDKNNEISQSEAAAVTILAVVNENITDLTGIEHFTNITGLYCHNNQLSSLDLSKNTALINLQCSNNQLESLDVSKNTDLRELSCYRNRLSSMDISQNTNLQTLVYYDNKFPFSALKSIKDEFVGLIYHSDSTIFSPQKEFTGYEADYSAEVSIGGITTEFTWYDNNDNEVDASFVQEQSDGIFRFLQPGAYYCKMTNAGFSGLELQTETLTIETVLNIPNTNFKAALLANSAINTNNDDEIYLSEALAFTGTLDVGSKNITDLSGIEYFTNITELDCSNNQLSSLDVTQNTALTNVNCSNNQLSSLDVSQNTDLTHLYCFSNQLSSLDVSQNTGLELLSCYNNQLSSLDLTQNTALTNANCSYNQLSSLDVSQNTDLTHLSCSNNQLSSLDLTQNTTLTNVNCSYNQLSSLDISSNTNLSQIEINHNKFPFSALQEIKEYFSGLTYASDSSISSPYEYGLEVDYSTEASFEGNATTFTWYNDSNVKVDETVVKETNSPGVFQFLTPGTYYCIMSNANFKDKNSNTTSLQTENITIGSTIHFPDDNFKKRLVELDEINTDGDNEISYSEAAAFTGWLYLGSRNITDLTGLEYFINMTTFSCYNNQISSLDISKNKSLTTLSCNYNQLSSLDISQNTALETLYCEQNKFPFSALQQIKDDFNGTFAYPGGRKIFSELKETYGFVVDYTTEVTIDGNTTSFTWYDNSGNEVDDTAVKETGTPGKFQFLKYGTYYCKMTNAAFSGLTLQTENIIISTTILTIPNANFKQALVENTDINTNNDTEITLKEAATFTGTLNVSDKNIDDLSGIEYFTSITQLNCSENSLSSLDLSKNTALTNLNCDGNQLSNLDISENTSLKALLCRSNKLNKLDVSANTNITVLFCQSNQLSNLDISQNTKLWNLNCSNNNLSSLDVSKNTDLWFLSCNHNKFPFSALKSIKDEAGRLSYTSDSTIFTTQEGAYGFEVDYSTEVTIGENETVFTWYDKEGNVMDNTAVKEQETKGVFQFLKPGTYYCKMTNEYFPGTELQTKNITITPTELEFPDDNFRQALIDNDEVNTTKDDVIWLSEAYALTGELNVLSKGIKDLSGIEYFINITKLNCSENELDSLDVSQNTALTDFRCASNSLDSLDVSKNTNITTLFCQSNQLSNLDVSENTKLEWLYCSENNLSELDVSKNTELTTLSCGNNYLTSLDLRNNKIQGISFGCNDNKFPFSELKPITDAITHVLFFNYSSDVPLFSPLEGAYGFEVDYSAEALFDENETSFVWYDDSDIEVDDSVVKEQETKGVFRFLKPGTYYCKMTNEYFPGTELKTDTISITPTILEFPDDKFKQALIDNDEVNTTKDDVIWLSEARAFTGTLNVSDKDIKDLSGIEYFTNITKLNCFYNSLSSLDISNNIYLTNLYCFNNSLSSLDVSKNTELTTLYCSSNNLSSLNISSNLALTNLSCEDNQLNNLDLSKNTALEYLFCGKNPLNSLNVSANTLLQKLYCNNSQLSSLDVSKNTELAFLACYENQLSSLNISLNTALTYLNCHSNQLQSLDVSQNTNLTTLSFNHNKFLFSALKTIKDDLITMTYASDSTIFTPQEGVYGFEVDYSTEALFDGNETAFTWYDKEGNAMDNTAVKEQETKGVFQFLKPGTYYCKMTNEYFPRAELKTDTITITPTVLDFPDAFKQALIDNDKVNTNKDDVIWLSEVLACTELDISDKNIDDLSGIEQFTNITHLDCSENSLNSLDISNNIYLTSLSCYDNSLSSLDVSLNTALENLYCFNNQLSNLNLNEVLINLSCDDNQLNNLDVSQNTALKELFCNNNLLSSLNVSANTALEVLHCNNNQLSSVNVENNTNLKDLSCSSNNISSLDVSLNTALASLFCTSNQLRSLDLSKNGNLTMLICNHNRFPFSVLDSIKNSFTNFQSQVYESDSILFSPQEGVYGFEVDYSAEALFDGNETTFTWYNDSDIEVNNTTVKEQETSGVFQFLKPGTYYCKMTNDYFPGTELKTETITITKNILEIPDVSFKQALVGNTTVNTDGDNEISQSEAGAFTGELNVSYRNIESLSGIEYFINTTKLNCSYNQLSSLDLSKNTALTGVNCNANQLSELKLGANTALSSLACNTNQLSSLDVSENTSLTYLFCSGNNLSNLDISYNKSLNVIVIDHNKFPFSALKPIKDEFYNLTYTSDSTLFSPQEKFVGFKMDYSAESLFNGNETTFTWYDNESGETVDNTAVKETDTPGIFQFLKPGVYYCKMKNATFQGTELQTATITVYENGIINFPDNNFKQALLNHDPAIDTDEDEEISLNEADAFTGTLNVSDKNISNLSGIEYFTNITTLYCSSNQLSSLDLSKNTALIYLSCSKNNNLSSLDLRQNTALKSLLCFENSQLTSLNLSKNTALTDLNCRNNALNSLDVSQNTALTKLYCYGNQLSSLDVSQNTELTLLSCYENQLSSLDVSQNTALISLFCYGNQLSSLDVSQNTILEYLYCYNNQLNSLDVSQNKNLRYLRCYENQLSSLDVSQNTNLKGLRCYSNQLSSLDLSNNTALISLTCYSNKFPFSALQQIKDEFSNLIYTSDSILFSTLEEFVNFEIDYSAESLFNGNETTFTWYDNESGETVNNTAVKETDTPGIFQFLLPGVYYCKMSNANFVDPDSNPVTLQTETITISEDGIINIPDANFKQVLVGKSEINTNGDTEISISEAAAFTGSIFCIEKNIADLTGIEYFTNITGLYCISNQLSDLDVSKNTDLKVLNCYGNQLSSLDLSQNTALTKLRCSNNSLGSLNLSQNTSLEYLYCNDNQLSSLNLSNNTSLTDLYCNNNQLSSLDLSNNTSLMDLYCTNNQLSSLDLSKNTALDDLNCGYNQLSSLDVSKNTALTHLACYGNPLSSLDVTQNTNLEYLSCYNNQLSNLDVSKNTVLTTLDCTNNKFPFSALKPIKDDFSNLTYTSDSTIFSSQEKFVGFEMDYSAESLFNGNETTFTWYNNDSGETVDNTAVNETNTSGVFQFLQPGVYYCKMTNEYFPGTELKTETITISTKEQNISFNPATEVKVNDEIELTATSDSGLEVSFEVVTGNASLNGNTITFTEAGTVTIKAVQDGDNEYAAAEQTATITVSKKEQNINFNPASEAKINDVLELTATATSNLPVSFELLSGNATLNGSSITFTEAGTVTIKAVQDGDDEYAAAEQTATITVSKKEQNINFNPASEAKINDVLELTATATSNLPVSFELLSGNATLNGSSITFTEAGTVTIKAVQDGDDEYAAAEQTATITVSKKEQNINFNPASEAKINDVLELTATATSNLPVTFELLSGNATLNGSSLTFTEAGTVTIKAVQNGDNEYAAAEQTATITVTAAVAKKEQNISFNPATEVKVNDVIELEATADSGLEVSFELVTSNASLNGNTITFTEAGTVTIKAVQNGDDEYAAAEQTVTITVGKKEQNISFNPATEAKINDVAELSATTDSGLEVSFELLTGNAILSGNTLTFNQTGTVSIRAYQEGNNEYATAEQTVTITVGKKEQSISFNPATEVKVNDVIELEATATSGLDVSFGLLSGNASLNGNTITFNEAGTVTIRAYQNGNGEYEATEESVEFTVSVPTSIDEDELSKTSVSIYPNPVVDELNIVFKNSTRKTISLYNLTGKLLIQTEAFNTKTMNVSNLQVGMYILRIQSEDKVLTYKIIKN